MNITFVEILYQSIIEKVLKYNKIAFVIIRCPLFFSGEKYYFVKQSKTDRHRLILVLCIIDRLEPNIFGLVR